MACGAVADKTAEEVCRNATCPPGTVINLSASSVNECTADGTLNVVTGSGEVEGKCFSEGTCEYACVPAEQCCGEVEWTEATYACTQVCCQDGTPPPCQTACGDGVCEPGEDPEGCPEDCGETCGDGACTGGETPTRCPEDCTGKPCAPDCTGRECGSDGCDGSCGDCWEDEFCKAGVCTPSECFPSCEGKVCGSDGCGGSCGTCNMDNQVCEDGKCICPGPLCEEECCLGGEVCTSDGKCCLPKCGGKECGSDGCGGQCGECAEGTMCNNGECLDVTCDDGNDVDWDGCTNGQISEWQVNTTTAFGQQRPSVGAFKEGGFLIAWDSLYQGNQTASVVAAVYDGEGLSADGESLVPGEGQGDSYVVSVQMPNGGILLKWKNGEARLFDADSTLSETAFHFSSPTGLLSHENYGRRTLVASVAGGFVAVATEPDGSDDGVVAQLLDGQGAPKSAIFQINENKVAHQRQPSLAILPNGEFLVTWASNGQDGDSYGVFGSIFDADGSRIIDEFPINTWTTDTQDSPYAHELLDDSFLVVWNSQHQDGDLQGIFGRVVGSSGEQISEEFQVNSVTVGPQHDFRVAAFADGGFVVVWRGAGVDGNGIQFRLFDPVGSPVAVEGRVNLNQNGPINQHVAVLSDDSFVVVWDSLEQDGTERDIFAQRFDKDGNKVYQ